MSCEQDPAQDRPRTAGECDRCSPARRNLYFRDKRMTIADYQIEQTHHIERRRLVTRSMLGWGVVQGFALCGGKAGITIGTGLAFDRCGRELVACETVTLAAPGDVVWLTEDECGPKPGDPPKPRVAQEPSKEPCTPQDDGPVHYLLSAHYAEVPVDGVRIDDGCGGARCEANHVCETVVYSLTPVKECPPGLPPCLCTPCTCGRCDDEEEAEPETDCDPDAPEGETRVAAVHDRGTHIRLVEWSEERLDEAHLCKPCRLHDWRGIAIDVDAGVPLACVAVDFDCDQPVITGILDACGPRRLAVPNDVLFDLIRGCDLTRIVNIGWPVWHGADEPIARSEFRNMFEPPSSEDAPQQWPVKKAAAKSAGRTAQAQNADDDESGGDYVGPSRTHFWIETSGPVQIASLKPKLFQLWIFSDDPEEGYQTASRIAVERVGHDPTTSGDPPGTTRRFWPFVSGYFYNGEIQKRQASRLRGQVEFRLTLDGNGVIDSCGQCLDADNRADTLPSGNGSPGGQFTSSFIVSPKGQVTPPHHIAALPSPEDEDAVQGEAE